MSRSIVDRDGDNLTIGYMGGNDHEDEAVYLHIRQQQDGVTGESHLAGIGPLDPHVLIEAIKAECELHEDDDESQDDEIHEVGPITQAAAEELTTGALHVKGTGRMPFRTLDEEIEEREEQPQTFPLKKDERGAFKPATAEEPRLWAGADEPVIDQIIGRVGDLEEEKERTEAHEHLARHWSDRLDVARQALRMTPRRGESKPTGALSAMFGTEKSGEVSVTDALKIARFAADEDRDIPGVDR